MQPQQITSHNQYESILAYYLQPKPVTAGSQMLQAVKKDTNFDSICNILSYVIPSNQLLIGKSDPILADPDYVLMNLCSKMANSTKGRSSHLPLGAGIDRLQQLQIKLDCLIAEMQDQNMWIRKKIDQSKRNKQQCMQDCQILKHQNLKLQNQLHFDQKQNKQSNREQEISKGQYEDRKQLQSILTKYHCQATGFPKNKNEANRLLSNLDIEIQGLQVQKLALS